MQHIENARLSMQDVTTHQQETQQLGGISCDELFSYLVALCRRGACMFSRGGFCVLVLQFPCVGANGLSFSEPLICCIHVNHC